MEILRTPEERFVGLPGFEHEPRYAEVDGLRIHYVEAGPPEADPVLLLHGEPTWSFLYRKVIPPLVEAGHRVVAPDMVGFGRSDKPAAVTDHTYAQHLAWFGGLLDTLDLDRITLVGQDWGGLLGLRLVAAEPDRFAGVVCANTGLPTGDFDMPEIWHRFKEVVATAPDLSISGLVRAGCARGVTDEVAAAYDAPFPDDSYKAGPRAMPGLVPITPDDPESVANRRAWAVLSELDLPVLCAFSDSDPITGPMGPIIQRAWRGAHDQPHTTIANAGHFLQEDAGEELGRVVADWLAGHG